MDQQKMRHNKMFLTLNEEVKADQLIRIKILLRNQIPDKHLEEACTTHAILVLLDDSGKIGVGSYQFLTTLLTDIKADRILKKIQPLIEEIEEVNRYTCTSDNALVHRSVKRSKRTKRLRKNSEIEVALSLKKMAGEMDPLFWDFFLNQCSTENLLAINESLARTLRCRLTKTASGSLILYLQFFTAWGLDLFNKCLESGKAKQVLEECFVYGIGEVAKMFEEQSFILKDATKHTLSLAEEYGIDVAVKEQGINLMVAAKEHNLNLMVDVDGMDHLWSWFNHHLLRHQELEVVREHLKSFSHPFPFPFKFYIVPVQQWLGEIKLLVGQEKQQRTPTLSAAQGMESETFLWPKRELNFLVDPFSLESSEIETVEVKSVAQISDSVRMVYSKQKAYQVPSNLDDAKRGIKSDNTFSSPGVNEIIQSLIDKASSVSQKERLFDQFCLTTHPNVPVDQLLAESGDIFVVGFLLEPEMLKNAEGTILGIWENDIGDMPDAQSIVWDLASFVGKESDQSNIAELFNMICRMYKDDYDPERPYCGFEPRSPAFEDFLMFLGIKKRNRPDFKVNKDLVFKYGVVLNKMIALANDKEMQHKWSLFQEVAREVLADDVNESMENLTLK